MQLSESFFSRGITGSVLLIIFRSLISLCFIRISFNLKNGQKNRPHDPCERLWEGTDILLILRHNILRQKISVCLSMSGNEMSE